MTLTDQRAVQREQHGVDMTGGIQRRQHFVHQPLECRFIDRSPWPGRQADQANQLRRFRPGTQPSHHAARLHRHVRTIDDLHAAKHAKIFEAFSASWGRR
jgi:hypothetical protein